MGSIDGSRIWGKETGISITRVEWSPDCKFLLFVCESGEVRVHDHHGNFLMNLPGTGDKSSAAVELVHWYDRLEGLVDVNAPALAVAFSNGRLNLLRNETDPQPILIDTGLTIQVSHASLLTIFMHCLTPCLYQRLSWNTNGSVLAVGGVSMSRGPEDKQASQVQFYSPFGAHLRTLRVPGSRLSGLTWESGGLRMALAVDSFIYFANVRPDYKWGYFANTLVYAYNQYDRPESIVVFYNVTTGEKVIKYVKNLLHVCTQGEFCALVTRVDEDSAAGSIQQYLIILCNAIGSPVEIKYVLHAFYQLLFATLF